MFVTYTNIIQNDDQLFNNGVRVNNKENIIMTMVWSNLELFQYLLRYYTFVNFYVILWIHNVVNGSYHTRAWFVFFFSILARKPIAITLILFSLLNYLLLLTFVFFFSWIAFCIFFCFAFDSAFDVVLYFFVLLFYSKKLTSLIFIVFSRYNQNSELCSVDIVVILKKSLCKLCF